MVEYGDILKARDRISDRLGPTPIIDDLVLSDRLRRKVRLKGELFQRTGSFKARGALNWVFSARREELERGLGAVSAGNHGIALAWAAGTAGVPVTVVMPENASPAKVEATRALGAEVILEGDVNQAWALMDKLVAERGLTLVHPYDDARIIAGQGTTGLEIINQVPRAGTILCPVGGGGLLAGLAIAARQRRPDIRIIGVEPAGAPTLLRAWQENSPVTLEGMNTIAASLGANRAGKLTLELTREYADTLVTVSDTSIRKAMTHLREHCKLVAEPGAATAMAALLDNSAVPHLSEKGDIMVVITGGNLSGEELKEVLG